MIRYYSDLIKIDSYLDRFEYLRLNGLPAHQTFGGHRWMNQELYQSKRWKHVRDSVILRDEGCDMAHPDYEIHGKLIVHHLNPITINDLLEESDLVYDPEFLVCVSYDTHNAIHYGDQSHLQLPFVPRSPNDTCPWKMSL